MHVRSLYGCLTLLPLLTARSLIGFNQNLSVNQPCFSLTINQHQPTYQSRNQPVNRQLLQSSWRIHLGTEENMDLIMHIEVPFSPAKQALVANYLYLILKANFYSYFFVHLSVLLSGNFLSSFFLLLKLHSHS